MRNMFFNPVKIILEQGALLRLPDILAGRTALLITSRGMLERDQTKKLLQLCEQNIRAINTEVIANPTIDSITKCFQEIGSKKFDVIIALGGGSTIDTAKGIAILISGSIDIEWLNNHLRFKADKPDKMKAKQIIAIPTTAGSGSEVTKWATIWDELSGDKYSLSDEILFPEWAVLDPELTGSLPYDMTLFTSLDSLSHAMEAIWNKKNNPISDVLASKAISLWRQIMVDSLYEKYSFKEYREKLLKVSLFAGLAFSNTQTALAHSISYPFTSKLGMPHGLACSFTLPEILKFNFKSNRERIEIIIRSLGCSSLNAAVNTLYKIFKKIRVPDYLHTFVSGKFKDISLSGNKYIEHSRSKNNINPISSDDIIEIIKLSLSHLLPDYQFRK